MSRSFTPPPTLSKDDVRTIADVRRDIWTSAFRGMAAGGFGCLGLHTVAYVGQGRKWIRLPATLTRNTAMASFMMGAAAGSFLSATATGKNEVHQLHPVFAIGARPPPPPSSSDSSPTAAKGLDADLLRAKRREDELKALVRQRRRASNATGIDRNDSGGGGAGDDRLERERIRLLRRASLQEQLQSGGAGSRRMVGDEDHSATTAAPKEPLFVDTPITTSTNERIDMQRNRLIRRASLTHSLQPHHHDDDHHTTPTSK